LLPYQEEEIQAVISSPITSPNSVVNRRGESIANHNNMNVSSSTIVFQEENLASPVHNGTNFANEGS